MRLYGRNWSRRELEARVGRLEQIGGVRRLEWSEGFEKGTELVQVRTGAGLAYQVSLSRGMDISLAEFGGNPISWQSSGGDTHPAFYDASGDEWLRTAVGGLLMTCGLTYVGASTEEGGLHGRAHHLPARHVAAEGHWTGDEYEMRVSGMVEETGLFRESLRLTRQITSWLGVNRIEIRDIVENMGFEPVPHMLLYHFNFGFPLLGDETEMTFPSREIVPRESETPVEGYDHWQSPAQGYQERVYYHRELITDADGRATAVIHNPHFPVAGGEQTCGLTVRLTWATRTLPQLVQWKMAGEGSHVLGIEPANCVVEGRPLERQRGTLVSLASGQSLSYALDLEVVCDG